jgi:3-vinyl bacteriochlorophyllide hydratase
MFAETTVQRWLNTIDASPWGAASGRAAPQHAARSVRARNFLYTPEERRRRDASPWTLVQGVLAPVQFAVFLMSLVLVARFMITGDGLTAATASVVVKTVTLYTIMITGAIWEREVFGRYLFAPAFYWEDVFSMLVLGLHTAYLAALFSGAVAPRDLMLLALAAYTAYVVNATQFVLKLRAARLEQAACVGAGGGAAGTLT